MSEDARPDSLEQRLAAAPLLVDILRHTKLCGPDTPTLIVKRLLGQRTGLKVAEVRAAYAELCQLGLMRPLEGKVIPRKYETSSIKKTLKRRAKHATPRKTHTYYELTRKGKLLLRKAVADERRDTALSRRRHSST